MTASPFTETAAEVGDGLVDRYAAVVCDLDGVVYRGPEIVEHAASALAALDVPVLYATNNASRPPADVAAHLRELGVEATRTDVVTSSQAGAAELAKLLPAGSTVLAVGGVGVREALSQQGFHVVLPREVNGAGGTRIDAVLQGYGASVMAGDLAEAAYAVSAGAVWVATNTDRTLPTHRGMAPGNGTLVSAVGEASGSQPVVVGKPHAPLYRLCAERLSVAPSRVLAVGDRLDTDIAGAVAAGMDSALVLTGVDSVTTLALAPPPLRPTYLLPDLRALAEAYVAAETDYAWWSCGADRRRIVDRRWEVSRRGSDLEAARAGLAALHEAFDLGDLDTDDVGRLVSDLDRWQ